MKELIYEYIKLHKNMDIDDNKFSNIAICLRDYENGCLFKKGEIYKCSKPFEYCSKMVIWVTDHNENSEWFRTDEQSTKYFCFILNTTDEIKEILKLT